MEPKEAAHIFGGFATEKRVRLLQVLMTEGDQGVTILELSKLMESSVADIGMALESLAGLGMINISLINN
jgi:hypothetical protein